MTRRIDRLRTPGGVGAVLAGFTLVLGCVVLPGCGEETVGPTGDVATLEVDAGGQDVTLGGTDAGVDAIDTDVPDSPDTSPANDAPDAPDAPDAADAPDTPDAGSDAAADVALVCSCGDGLCILG